MPEHEAESAYTRFRRWLRGDPNRRQSEEAAAAERWRAHNARARAEGCKCGKPATRVRYMGGTVGGVPAATYSCDEHVNVNGWSRVGDGPWVPNDEYDAASLAWLSEPQVVTPPDQEYDPRCDCGPVLRNHAADCPAKEGNVVTSPEGSES